MPSARTGNCSATVVPVANRQTTLKRGPIAWLSRVRAVKGDVLIFSSGHFLRVLTSRWLGLGSPAGRVFPAEHCQLERAQLRARLSQPVIQLWNDMHHLMHH